VSNCTFVGNETGFANWSDFPKGSSSPSGSSSPDSSEISNNICAFNRSSGMALMSPPEYFGYKVVCNNSYGNNDSDWVYTSLVGHGDTFGNLSLHPLFCDTTAGDFHLAVESPCAPANNSCGVLMGAFSAACTCCVGIRGNVDGDAGDQINVADLTYLVDYLFKGGNPPPCPDEGNVDGIGATNVADLTYLVDYLFRGGPEPPPCL
jgi:hypothetical protein